MHLFNSKPCTVTQWTRCGEGASMPEITIIKCPFSCDAVSTHSPQEEQQHQQLNHRQSITAATARSLRKPAREERSVWSSQAIYQNYDPGGELCNPSVDNTKTKTITVTFVFSR